MSRYSWRKNVEPRTVVALLAAVVSIAVRWSLASGSPVLVTKRPNLNDASATNGLRKFGQPTAGAPDVPATSGAFRVMVHVCAWRYFTLVPSGMKTAMRRGPSISPGLPNNPDSIVRNRDDRPTSQP